MPDRFSHLTHHGTRLTHLAQPASEFSHLSHVGTHVAGLTHRASELSHLSHLAHVPHVCHLAHVATDVSHLDPDRAVGMHGTRLWGRVRALHLPGDH